MSTAELGPSLVEIIREEKVHAISCTGANLEEDIFNLVAHDYYLRLPHYRELSAGECARSSTENFSSTKTAMAQDFRHRCDNAHVAAIATSLAASDPGIARIQAGVTKRGQCIYRGADLGRVGRGARGFGDLIPISPP